MVAAYNQAIDTLAENLRWLLSAKGFSVLTARAQYLTEHRLAYSDGVKHISTDDVRATIAGILSEAEPVYWPKRFCEIVEQSFATLPLSWRLTDPMLFTPRGFIYFEEPISLLMSHPSRDDCTGAHDRVAGIGWRKVRGTVFVDITSWVMPGDQSIMSVFEPAWMINHVSDRTYQKLDRLVRRAKEREEQLEAGDALLHVTSEALDENTELYRRLMYEAHQEAGVIRHGGIPWQLSPWRSGQTIEQTLDRFNEAVERPQATCQHCARAYLRLYGTVLNFLASKVFISVPSHTDRAVLRRLARGSTHKPQWNSVNVVTLRRAEHVKHESDQEETHREWSCHWLVGSASGGFWRHQPMKNADGQWIKQWRWIMPYVKGDMSKPFKPPGKRIFVVER